jgi:hypothetical protein
MAKYGHHEQAESVLAAYRKEVDALADSLAGTIREVGELAEGNPRKAAEANRYVLATAAAAFDILAKSLAGALSDVGDRGTEEFASNAESFRTNLRGKAESFKEIVRS